MAENYYAIKKGIGIITDSWGICRKHTQNTNFRYKSFRALDNALRYLGAESLSEVRPEFKMTQTHNNYYERYTNLPAKAEEESDCDQLMPGNYKVYVNNRINPREGYHSFGIIFIKDNKIIKTYSECYRSSTDERIEILSAVKALSLLSSGCNIELHSTALTFIRKVNGSCPIDKNYDLWKKLNILFHKHLDVKFVFDGDTTDPEIYESCRMLAAQALSTPDLHEDIIGLLVKN